MLLKMLQMIFALFSLFFINPPPPPPKKKKKHFHSFMLFDVPNTKNAVNIFSLIPCEIHGGGGGGGI
jgi:hypothetical protein